jgi:hypothetical protein
LISVSALAHEPLILRRPVEPDHVVDVDQRRSTTSSSCSPGSASELHEGYASGRITL